MHVVQMPNVTPTNEKLLSYTSSYLYMYLLKYFSQLTDKFVLSQPWLANFLRMHLNNILNYLPSVDKPDVMSSVFLAASSLIRKSCTRASVELSFPPWFVMSWLSSWLSWQGEEVRSCTREAMFCLLSSTRFINNSKL